MTCDPPTAAHRNSRLLYPTFAAVMHLLLIHQYFLEKDDGGGSRFNEMARYWAAQGHRVTVLAGMVHYNTGKKLARYQGRYFYKEQYAPGITVLRCHVSESYNTSFAGRMWGYLSFVASGLWGAITRLEGRFDAIIVTSPPLFVGITGYVLQRCFRAPLIFEIRDLWPESAIDTGVLKSPVLIRAAYAFERFIYRKSALINVLTPAFRQTLVARKGVPAAKVVLIPNAADFSLADGVARRFDRTAFRRAQGWEGKFVALYVGAHGVANHLVQVLEAAELLRHTPALLVLIGDGMQRPWLLQEAERRNLHNVVLLPPVSKERVFEYILGADAGLSVLKKADTFKTVYSNKTFDYMACRRPIVMGIDGVSRELVETAGCGLYAEPEQPQALADAIAYLMAHPDKAAQMGEAGNTYARAHFDRAALATTYLDKITGLLRHLGRGR